MSLWMCVESCRAIKLIPAEWGMTKKVGTRIVHELEVDGMVQRIPMANHSLPWSSYWNAMSGPPATPWTYIILQFLLPLLDSDNTEGQHILGCPSGGHPPVLSYGFRVWQRSRKSLSAIRNGLAWDARSRYFIMIRVISLVAGRGNIESGWRILFYFFVLCWFMARQLKALERQQRWDRIRIRRQQYREWVDGCEGVTVNVLLNGVNCCLLRRHGGRDIQLNYSVWSIKLGTFVQVSLLGSARRWVNK